MYGKSSSSSNTNTILLGHLTSEHINPIGNVFVEAGNNLVKHEFGAYGEKIFGSSSSFLQSNFVSRHLSNPQYYFEVNDDYVNNKIKMILFPFLHKGHWIRATEMVGGGEILYKPPYCDINAPDLYIPMMAFGTCMVLAGFFLGINGKFSPEALGVHFTTALLCWILQVLLLGAALHSLGGGGDIPLLDLVAYGGYIFTAASVVIISRIIWDHLFCAITLWESFCMGVFLVKTMKRILISEVKRVDYKHSSKRDYLLLSIAISQIPLLFWIASICVKS
ncbi:uncharacterized protein [Coffea arabica]|uniref:Protein YIF1B-like n=1 Tax=Coffea arabica TaxID=13443 RepID=A0ABM4UXV1_COFAR|nr:protein YIF1B-like [Coffea arabica]